MKPSKKKGMKRVKRTFGEALLMARKQKGLSQQQLADNIPVNRSSVANWEANRRLPDASMIARIAEVLGVEIKMLFDTSSEEITSPIVIIVDDNKIVLTGGEQIIKKAIPNALVVGFSKPSQAIEYAKEHLISLAFLDIELGLTNGIDLCNTLLEINPHMNAIFLTAYPEYAINAWNTDASGFMVKPITIKGVQAQLKKLRYPITSGGNSL